MPRRTNDEPSTTRARGRSAGTGETTMKVAKSGRLTGSKAAPRGRFTTSRGRAAAPATIRVSPTAEVGYPADGPVARVVDALGNNVVADLLGVTRSHPSRWRSGQERPSPESRERLSDLDHVLDRLLLELHPDQAGLWLTGPNPHLSGARPIDVLELHGAAAVLPAIDALAAGAFA